MRKKRFFDGGAFNIANLFAFDFLGTYIRPTNFILLRLKLSIAED